MLILKDEHAIDVLKSGNTGHLWHDFHAIGVHATDVGHPDDETGSSMDDVMTMMMLMTMVTMMTMMTRVDQAWTGRPGRDSSGVEQTRGAARL